MITLHKEKPGVDAGLGIKNSWKYEKDLYLYFKPFQ